MANQYTAKPIPSCIKKLYEQGYTQTEIAKKFCVSQKTVFTWFKKLNIKSRIPKKEINGAIKTLIGKGIQQVTQRNLSQELNIKKGYEVLTL